MQHAFGDHHTATRKGLWADCARIATDVENMLLSLTYKEVANKVFMEKDLPNPEYMKQFGEMAVIKYAPKVKNKLEDRGLVVMHVGRAPDHPDDAYKFFNFKTRKTIISRDVIWLKKVWKDMIGRPLIGSYNDLRASANVQYNPEEDELLDTADIRQDEGQQPRGQHVQVQVEKDQPTDRGRRPRPSSVEPRITRSRSREAVARSTSLNETTGTRQGVTT